LFRLEIVQYEYAVTRGRSAIAELVVNSDTTIQPTS